MNNTAGYTLLLTAGATLIAIGVPVITQNLLEGAVIFLLGVGAFVAYRLLHGADTPTP